MALLAEVDSHQKMQNGLEKAVSPETSKLIAEILERINQLSDVGKLLLYLKLPTGAAAFHQTTSRADKESGSGAVVLNWIKTHLEENGNTCLPKQDVYDNYRKFAERHQFTCVSMADFTKMLKTVCPSIRDRRLGKRGNTKYVHSGVQYISELRPYNTPEIIVPMDLKRNNHIGVTDEGDDLCGAAGVLVLEWARKLFEREFSGITKLAEHLITSGYVSNRSLEAFSIIASASSQSNGTSLGLLSTIGHDNATMASSTHAQLRKNIQEREAMSRLKIKLEEQKINASSNVVDRTPVDRLVSEHQILSLTTGPTKLPPRKVAVPTATPPKRILPKVTPATDYAPPNHTIRTSTASVGSNGASAHYVLLSPNPTHAQTQMFIIPPSMVDNQAVRQSAISMVSQPPIVSQRSAGSSFQSINKPLILSPLISADTIRSGTAIPIVDASSNTIRSISFVEPSCSDVSLEGGRPTERVQFIGSGVVDSTTETIRDGIVRQECSVRGLARGAILDVRENNVDVLPGEAYSISNLFDVLMSQNCHGAVKMADIGVPTVTSSGSVAMNQTQVLFGSSLVASLPQMSSASPCGESDSVTNENIGSTMMRGRVVQKQRIQSSSKTVMSLLRESQTDGNGENRSYMKDSRPVARILKEEREKQQKRTAVTTNGSSSEELVWSPIELSMLSKQSKQDNNTPQFASFTNKAAPVSTTAPCSLLKELLTSRHTRRPSSVMEMGLSAMLPQIASPSLEVIDGSSSLGSSRGSRKRPHTALDDPLSTSGIWSENINTDRSSCVDFIEKGSEEILIFDDVIQNFLSAHYVAATNKVIQPSAGLNNDISYNVSFAQDVDKMAEPPIKRFTFVNRSVENLTLQQLQQARDSHGLTPATDASSRTKLERWRHQSDGDQPHGLSALGSRPVSAFGELNPSSDMSSFRDSRPNTVTGIWEPNGYGGCNSSADSCDSSGPIQPAISQDPPFFTPIQVHPEDLQTSVSCDLVKPLAKVAVSHTECDMPSKQGVSLSSGLQQEFPTSSSSLARGGRGNKRGARTLHRLADQAGVIEDSQPKSMSVILSPCFRSETPLSAEVSNIISAGDQRVMPTCSAVGGPDPGHIVVDDVTSSPHRSQSVPVGFLFDLDDISAEFANDPCFDMFDGKSVPSYSDLDDFQLLLRRPARKSAAPESRAGFWESLPRGDHLISGSSFCANQCSRTATVDCCGGSNTTPPTSQNSSPSFDRKYHQRLSGTVVCTTDIDTPTSLEQGPNARDNLVDELFINNVQLATSSASYDWEDDVVSVGHLIVE